MRACDLAEHSDDPKSVAPLLKWPGGKRSLARQICEVFPKTYGRYFEPFLGGGAVFFTLRPKTATLADKNRALIETYRQVRDYPYELIQRLRAMPNTEADYYRIRAQIPNTASARAARFVYLCTLAFNGIHRYNLRGEFNVPYGFKTHVEVCDEERILDISCLLKGAALLPWDFEKSVAKANDGDLIYFDPPYTVAHNNNGFVKYNAAIFSWEDQKRLARVAREARDRGCHVVVSNADHRCVRELYKGFKETTIMRHSIIGGGKEYRRPITEALFWN
jgi:DNA adenine methylase